MKFLVAISALLFCICTTYTGWYFGRLQGYEEAKAKFIELRDLQLKDYMSESPTRVSVRRSAEPGYYVFKPSQPSAKTNVQAYYKKKQQQTNQESTDQADAMAE